MPTRRIAGLALVICSLFISGNVLRILLIIAGVFLLFGKRRKTAERPGSKQGSQSATTTLDMLPIRRYQGKELLRRRTELYPFYNEGEVAARCGYYVIEDERHFSVDRDAYLEAIDEALASDERLQNVETEPLKQCLDDPAGNTSEPTKTDSDTLQEAIPYDTNLDADPQSALIEKEVDCAALWQLITGQQLDNIDSGGRNFLHWTEFPVDEEAAEIAERNDDWDAYDELETALGVGLSGEDFGYGEYICKNPYRLPRMIKDYVNKGGSVSTILQAIGAFQESPLKTISSHEAESSLHIEWKDAIRLTVIETGGHFTMGQITDPSLALQIREKIIRSEMLSSLDLNEKTYFDATDYNDLLDIYGPHVPGSLLIVEDEGSNELYRGPIDDSGINIFRSSNPKPWLFKKSRDDLIVFSKKIEKRIHYSVELQRNPPEPLRLEEIYIGYCLMDETFGTDDEILEYVLYIPNEDARNYYIEFVSCEGKCKGELGGSESADDFRDVVEELFEEEAYADLAKKIVSRHRVSGKEIEGKGEWEYDYIKVAESTSENFLSEFLYEHGGD